MEIHFTLDPADEQAILALCASMDTSADQLFYNISKVLASDEEAGMDIAASLFFHPAHIAHLQRGISAIKKGQGVKKSDEGVEWFSEAWQDYAWWENQDKKTLKRINALIQSILRDGLMEGIGKPEPLKGELSGFYSRRIDACNRLVYQQDGDDIAIISCKGHYA